MGILAFFNGILLRIIGLIMSAIMVWTVPPSRAVTIEAKDPDNLKLQVSVFADIHMQSFTHQNYYQLTRALRDIGNSRQQQDALVLLGDNTMNGQVFEYFMLYSLLARYNRARNTVVVMGNHDLNLRAMSAGTAIDRHNFFLRSYNRVNNDKAYYSQVINGYTFIVIAAEGPDDEREISDAQIAWVAETLVKTPAGRPVFVFAHQNIDWFSRGAALRNMFERYSNVFVFNGHWHTPLSQRPQNGVNYVNVPGLHSHVSYDYAGEGLQIEVYENEVVLRGRNYMTGEWLEEIVVGLE
jgi:hypothetical protein